MDDARPFSITKLIPTNLIICRCIFVCKEILAKSLTRRFFDQSFFKLNVKNMYFLCVSFKITKLYSK